MELRLNLVQVNLWLVKGLKVKWKQNREQVSLLLVEILREASTER